MKTKEKVAVVLAVAAVLAMAVLAVWLVMQNLSESERNVSCQRRCEPRRWKILEEHCYCRDQPDEWHGIDKEPEKR